LLDLFFVSKIVRFVSWVVMQFKEVVTIAAVANCKHVQLDMELVQQQQQQLSAKQSDKIKA
jgi:hypothetical protein